MLFLQKSINLNLMKHVKVLGSLFAFSAIATAASAQEGVQPNIVIFLVDDMGLMDTSLPFITDEKGNPQAQPLNSWYRTPNMESLAEQGVRFTRFYAQSVSSPSRASILTGQGSARHGTTQWIDPWSNNKGKYGPADWNWEGLTSDDVTLASVLKGAGYKTIHVGKAHFGPIGSEGEEPTNLGFDVNIAGCSYGQPGSYYGENGYGHTGGNKNFAVPGLEEYHGTDTYLSDALTLEANKEISKAVEEGRPFFLNFAHYAAHAPFEADKRFADNYADSDKPQLAKAFATIIEGMDKSLGDLMAHLEKEGVAENTIIIFLGDNGSDAPLDHSVACSSSAPLRGFKGTEYEGGVRVPFIASWAKNNPKSKLQKSLRIAQGGVQTQMADIMDIFPTITELVAADVPESHVTDGASLRRLLTGREDKEHDQRFLAHFPHAHNGSYYTSLIEGEWKLTYYYNPEEPENPTYKLYHLTEDIDETHDLSKAFKGKLEEMKTIMVEELEAQNAKYPVDKDGNELRPQ